MEAAQQIHSYGPKHVLIKGGHLEGEALDVLFDGRVFTGYKTQRIETKNTHGTGCTYSAAIATMLAQGLAIHEAVKKAKTYVTAAIQYALKLGQGHGPTNHYAFIEQPILEIEVYRIA